MKKIIYLCALSLIILTACEKEGLVEEESSKLQQVAYKGKKSNKKKKVLICHYEAETDSWKQLEISENAVQAHLNHGDSLGECTQDIDQFIAYYPFNGNANDESGFDNNGTVVGAQLTSDRFGNSNSAYSFDGIDDFIQVPASTENSLANNDFTISTWFRSTSVDESIIFNKRNTSSCSQASGPTILFGQTSQGNGNQFRARARSSGDYQFASTQSVSDSMWHMVSMVRIGTSLSVYLDGNLVETKTIPVNTDFTTTLDLFIGKTIYCSGSHFTGDIDDFSIIDRGLDENEILLFYDQQST